MLLSEFKKAVSSMDELTFVLPNGKMVPSHFHLTEIGEISKHFIDCGGVERLEKVVNFQLWEANDVDHRLVPQRCLDIIQLSEKVLKIGDLEIEVEYQDTTISKYGLELENNNFLLTPKFTDCLAKDKCDIPEEKLPENACIPGGGCC